MRLGVVILLLLGGAMSWRAARMAEHAAAARYSNAFAAVSHSALSALAAEISRAADYVVTTRTLFATFPHLTNPGYRTWSSALSVSTRYPGSRGFAFIEKVPQGALARFSAERAADPVPGTAAGAGRISVFPAGRRPDYCLLRLAYTASYAITPAVASFDYCAPIAGVPFRDAFADAAASGHVTAIPPVSALPSDFYLVAPVYRTVATPSSVAARRASLVGWALGSFNGNAMLAKTLSGIHGYGVRLDSLAPGGARTTVAALGPATGAERFVRTLPFGAGAASLVATITRTADHGAFLSGLVVGLLALGVTILLTLVFWLLARSRTRALLLVDERTGELRHQALHDALTGLPNRTLIAERTEELLARAAHEPLTVGVLFVDLDNFKDINDSFGHQHGDELLRAVAGRLSAIARAQDSVGRLGGDEFVILVEAGPNGEGPSLLAERALEALAVPFSLPGLADVPLALRASIGVAVGVRASADELLRDADVALYQAKQGGKGRSVLFHPAMQLAVQDRLALEIDLRAAVENGELFVEYQPTFDLRSLRMNGVEALVRWRSPTRGVVGPDAFIPVAEESGLILPIGRAVLREACRQAARWRAEGHVVPLSVNVSGRQLETDIVPVVEAVLAESGLPPGLLTLELTESVLMRDTEATIARLQRLKALGVRIAIDDFGTGYSSLAYVRQFPIDGLKIDRCFVSHVTRSSEALALVRMLVQLGKTLGIETVAEGIEDEDQLAELQREQCDHGQGFYYARPLSVAAVDALLREEAPPVSA